MTVAVKICGLNAPPAVQAAVEGGARFVGFVFFPSSPRHVTSDRMAALASAVPAGVTRVGLVVDADDATLADIVARAPLDMLQLHGGESPARVANIRTRFGVAVMKTISIAGPEDVAAARDYQHVADRLLFDARPPPGASRPGGNARAFDWELLRGETWRLPWLLAGGLDADALAKAVRVSGARAVDVSSGVEDRPGVKNPAKIRDFLSAAARL